MKFSIGIFTAEPPIDACFHPSEPGLILSLSGSGLVEIYPTDEPTFVDICSRDGELRFVLNLIFFNLMFVCLLFCCFVPLLVFLVEADARENLR